MKFWSIFSNGKGGEGWVNFMLGCALMEPGNMWECKVHEGPPSSNDLATYLYSKENIPFNKGMPLEAQDKVMCVCVFFLF